MKKIPREIILSVKPGETKELNLDTLKVSRDTFRARATEINMEAVRKGIMKKGESLYSILTKEQLGKIWIRNNMKK